MDDERAFAPGQALEAGRTLLGIEPARAGERSSGPGATGGRVAFNRPPRVARPQPAHMPPAPAVPGEGDSPRLPLGAALVPLAIGGSMAAITGNPALLSFALLTPAMALFSHVEGRRSGSRRHDGEVVDFRRDVAELGEQLRAARLAETEERRAASPDVATLRRWATTLDPRLWERRPRDPDFLELRVGTADVLATARVELAPGGAQDLRERGAEGSAARGAPARGAGHRGAGRRRPRPRRPGRRGGRARAPARDPGGRPAQPRRARGRDGPRRGRGGLGVGGVAAARAARRRGRGQRGRPRAVRGDRRRRPAGARRRRWRAAAGARAARPGRRGGGWDGDLPGSRRARAARDLHARRGAGARPHHAARCRRGGGHRGRRGQRGGDGAGRRRGGGAPARPRGRCGRRGRARRDPGARLAARAPRHARADRRDCGAALAGERGRSALADRRHRGRRLRGRRGAHGGPAPAAGGHARRWEERAAAGADRLARRAASARSR